MTPSTSVATYLQAPLLHLQAPRDPIHKRRYFTYKRRYFTYERCVTPPYKRHFLTSTSAATSPKISPFYIFEHILLMIICHVYLWCFPGGVCVSICLSICLSVCLSVSDSLSVSFDGFTLLVKRVTCPAFEDISSAFKIRPVKLTNH